MTKVYLSDSEIAEINRILCNDGSKPQFLNPEELNQLKGKFEQLSLQ